MSISVSIDFMQLKSAVAQCVVNEKVGIVTVVGK
jgi:hypothetical protein